MVQFTAFLLVFLAVTTIVVQANFARGGKGIFCLHDRLLQLAKPAQQLGTKYNIPDDLKRRHHGCRGGGVEGEI